MSVIDQTASLALFIFVVARKTISVSRRSRSSYPTFERQCHQRNAGNTEPVHPYHPAARISGARVVLWSRHYERTFEIHHRSTQQRRESARTSCPKAQTNLT